jgi:hypothetical protein
MVQMHDPFALPGTQAALQGHDSPAWSHGTE